MVILGIDPGTRVTGFGVIKRSSDHHVEHIQHGVIQLDSQAELPVRLAQLGEDMAVLISRYKPDVVVIEKIFLGKNADSAFKLGHARGVVMYEAIKNNCQVYEYATRVVKKGISGTGAATKEEVAFFVSHFLSLKGIKYLDASDALALAIYHSRCSEVKHKMENFL